MADRKPPIKGEKPATIENREADPTPDTGNEKLQDRSLRHQVGVRRFSSHEIGQAMTLLAKSDKELTSKLRKRLEALEGRPLDFTSERFKLLRDDIRGLRKEMMKQARTSIRKDLLELGMMEQDFEKRIFQTSVPVELNFATASASTIASSIRTKAFAGGANAARTLQQWFDTVSRADQRRIMEAVQLGLVQEETVDQIVSRVKGTSSAAFENGTLAQTRRNMQAVVRTSISHVVNASREEFFKANEDVIAALRWTSVLDGRTSLICIGRDGKMTSMGDSTPGAIPPGKQLEPPSARPPAHPNCRSLMIAVLDPVGVEQKMPARPFVTDTRTGRKRQVDFRAETKQKVGADRWKGMTATQRNAAVKRDRTTWAKKNVGTVPAETNYDTWLRKQSSGFQDEVLGPTRAKAFRGGLKADKFTDRRGTELNLKQLRATEKEFF